MNKIVCWLVHLIAAVLKTSLYKPCLNDIIKPFVKNTHKK